MRVLLLTQYFWPESFPINAFIEPLESAGASVTVLTGQPNYPDGVVFPGYRAASVRRETFGRGTEVIRLPIVPRGEASGIRLATNYLWFVLAASVLGPWLLRGRRFDVVFVYAPSPIVQSIPGMVLRRLRRAKLVTWVQDLWPQSLETTGHVRNRLLLRLADGMVRWIYRGNDLLLGTSNAFVAAIKPLAGRTPVEFFPNPGDATFADSSPGEVPKLVLPRGFNVVFAGNLGTVQALDTVLDAAELLRDDGDVRIVLVGSGSRSAWLAEQVASRNLSNVMLPGRFDREEMPRIFAQSDALLVTLTKGLALSQTIPSKVQSYLAAGRPILASLDGEGASLVSDAKAGYTSPAEDAAALAENVRRLKRLSAHERTRMGEAGRSYYDAHFQPRVLADQLVARFRKLANNQPSPGMMSDHPR